MNERGSAPLELALGALVLLLPAALLVLSFGPLLERRNLARAMASDAARTYVLTEGDLDVTVELLTSAAGRGGIDPSAVRVGLCGLSVPLATARTTCDLGRVGWVEVTVELPAGVSFVPGGTGYTVSYRHREPLDPYRSRT